MHLQTFYSHRVAPGRGTGACHVARTAQPDQQTSLHKLPSCTAHVAALLPCEQVEYPGNLLRRVQAVADTPDGGQVRWAVAAVHCACAAPYL